MMHFVRTFSIMRAYDVRLRLLISQRLEIMKKLYTSKTFSKMAGGRRHTPDLKSLDTSQAISYKNHQKSLAYFSHLAPLTLLFFY